MDSITENTAVLATLGIVVLLVLAIGVVVRRYKVGGPDEAFIITGRKGRSLVDPETGRTTVDASGQRIITGAGVFVLPFVQKLHVMSLASRRIPIAIAGAVSAQGIRTSLEGVAIVKVGGTEDSIRAAAQRFLGQQQAIDVFTQEVLAGSLRAIVGRLTIDEIIKDRAAFASAVAEEAETSLTNQGLSLDTFQLQDIQAEGTYLTDLGRPESARVAQDAAIAEARAREAAEKERLLAEENIAVANRQLGLRQAEIQSEIDAAQARAAAAGPLAQAAKDQEVLAEQEKVAEHQAALTERQLDTEVRRPADAQRYRVEQEAQGQRNAQIFAAEAEKSATIARAEAASEQARLSGEGERARRSALAAAEEIEGRARGNAQLAERQSIAEAVEREGAAEASAIRAKGEAEADAMQKRADAFEQYGEAAVLEMVATMLPELVRGAAEPLSAIEHMTVISTDGASQLTRNVAGNVAQGLQLATDLTGIDIRNLLSRRARDNAEPVPAADPPAPPESAG
ncbi:MAG: flotillin family protein [Acidimicrobiia bacterium]